MEKLDKQYLKIARLWSENSTAKKLKVAAIIVKNRQIISDGYNGTPSGFDNTCEDSKGDTYPWVLHAEANAITKVAKSTNNSEGSTIYTLVSPCMECAKLIIQAGIVRVVYAKVYRNTSGIELLLACGVQVEKIEIKVA